MVLSFWTFIFLDTIMKASWTFFSLYSRRILWNSDTLQNYSIAAANKSCIRANVRQWRIFRDCSRPNACMIGCRHICSYIHMYVSRRDAWRTSHTSLGFPATVRSYIFRDREWIEHSHPSGISIGVGFYLQHSPEIHCHKNRTMSHLIKIIANKCSALNALFTRTIHSTFTFNILKKVSQHFLRN